MFSLFRVKAYDVKTLQNALEKLYGQYLSDPIM